ncbi:MAG: PRC-barrel domain-containing protein [Thermodesulfobacteriota bacterium]
MKKLLILLISILAAALFLGQSLADVTKTESSAYTAEQLIGLNVNDLEGKHVGIIRDVNLNSDTKEIDFIILGKSLLGIGEDKFEVPVEAFKIEHFKESVSATLIVSEITLLTPPNIAADKTKTESSAYLAEQLIGLNVDNLEGKHVGIIRDVNLNSATGEINYVILGKSLLGIGEDKFAVPLEALKISNDKGATDVKLVVSEIKVISAPNFETAESDEEFKDLLLNHYCAVPDIDDDFNVLARC